MALGPHLVTRAALDPFGFFILVIILFNVVSTIIAGLKRAGAKAAAKADDSQAQTRLAQALKTSTVATSQASAARAAQLERIRRALLAAAGTPDQSASEAQNASYTATVQPVAAPVTYRATATPAPASRAPMPPAPIAASAPVLDMGPGFATPALMTLESGTTAFDRLATATALGGTGLGGAVVASAPAALALLQMPNSGANLFIAAAIVGPCAAFRPIGHTPGGW